MLLHIDASRHLWFQDELWYDLIVTLDDATSQIYSHIDRKENRARVDGSASLLQFPSWVLAVNDGDTQELLGWPIARCPGCGLLTHSSVAFSISPSELSERHGYEQSPRQTSCVSVGY
jgi:hypothetical protein